MIKRRTTSANWEQILCPYCKNWNNRSLISVYRYNLFPVNKWTKCDYCKKRVYLK
jgi:hypothetical protein